MDIKNLGSFDAGSRFETDVVIVGSGPAGLTVAREFFQTSTRILIVESGLIDETPDYAALNELESIGEPSAEVQRNRRTSFHGASLSTWSAKLQPYGVRCRAFGGSTHAWAGKSAPLDPIDFVQRPWVPHSGWPIDHTSLKPFLDRAIQVLNLGPNVDGEGVWKLMGIEPPRPELDSDGLRSFFWQFARSRLDRLDVMRFGREFAAYKADNVRVLLNATVCQIGLSPDGRRFDELEVSTIEGVRSTVKARIAVIAAGGIENARLLLASNRDQACGVGNTHDVVGRFLMDHAGARVARLDGDAIAPVTKRFGFYGVRHGGRTHMYMHGLVPTPALQERERLLNASVCIMEERSPADPWDALKRLLRRDHASAFRDAVSVLSGAKLLASGIGMKALASHAMPDMLKKIIVDTAIRHVPDFAAAVYLNRGVPHKLTSLSVDVLAEQKPDRESRITLSKNLDRLGIPMAKAKWRIHDDERRTIIRLAHLVRHSFGHAGLPEPVLEPWVMDDRPEDGVIIDMAHTMGTTRMSDNPRHGVVDRDCRVHNVDGLFIAGSSVFPTSGHANPTLMICTLAIRLADTIKSNLR
jgi:choline dehydrogenase-like flavoprotein